MQKETEFREVPQAEKHYIFEEAKEVQPGQSVRGMLKGRTGEDAHLSLYHFYIFLI